MAILEGANDASVVLFIFVIGALFWMIKLAYDLKNAILAKSKTLDSKVANLEGKAISIRKEVQDLNKNIHQKLDKEEFEKRIDGLIDLVGKKKEPEKRKDMR
ncbi:hypothetical protein HY989_06070 [Candidatus Micrarchaeota archaeon]|nr:hypothetical protein [Candidatus Micrarchaeota archaeon]